MYRTCISAFNKFYIKIDCIHLSRVGNMGESTMDSEFEKRRETLLNQYHSENLTHSGFIIAIIIGTLSLVANFKDFFNNGVLPILAFYFFMSFVVVLAIYFAGRLYYWIALSNSILTLTEKMFDEYKTKVQAPLLKDGKIPIDDDRPNIAYMQTFGKQRIDNFEEFSIQTFFAKLSPGRLLVMSLFIGLVLYNVLILFSLYNGIFDL
jgi:hypothetical protein